MVRLVVDTWDVNYGTGYAIDDDLPVPEIDLGVEQAPAGWVPVEAPAGPGASEVLFIDGVQRSDARVTVVDDDERTIAGMAGSFAAGAVRHAGGRATVEQVTVRRALFTHASDITLDCGGGVLYSPVAVTDTTPEAFTRAMSERRGALETLIAASAAAELVVLDGPLDGDHYAPGAVGLVKTHWRRYLEGDHDRVVASLGPRQRTPVFLVRTRRSRYSWYLRLPGPMTHPWSGIVRCEASGDLRKSEVLRLAGVTAATLPRFASSPHRDPRAPQNLTCVGELERCLRHRLGDKGVLERLLRRRCATWTA